MAFPPVAVFIGGSQLEGYTGLTISRSKEELTGSCTIDLFFNYMPTSPVIMDAAISQELLVYIGGQLAFTGTVDRRTGSGVKHGSPGSTVSEGSAPERSVSIGPNEYTVQITGRGKVKRLIDSSHQHNKTNLLKTNTREAIEKLIEPFDIQLEFIGTQIDLDKVRFRDGAIVLEELRRIATENSYYIYETREGKLRVTDDVGPGQGEALVLGQNILSFSATQSEEEASSEITVKGQRTPKDKWGEEAILQNTTTVFADDWVPSYSPIVIQHYGDGTKESLERRARFEANKRSAKSKTITIEVFHVQPQSGEAWDLGMLHYVQVPPEGIFDTFECTGIQITVTNNNELKTTLTLSPPPAGGQSSGGGLSTFENTDQSLVGITQQAALQVSVAPGQYPFPWTGPNIIASIEPAAKQIIATLAGVSGLEKVARGDQPNTPPLKLPVTFNRSDT